MTETKDFEELFISNYEEITGVQKEEIKILLISDLHKNYKSLEKLKEWQMVNKIYFDYLFFGGDFVSMTTEEQQKVESNAIAEGEISGILNMLETICLEVFYVPGNMDPISIFPSRGEQPKSLSNNSANVHNRFVKLDHDLYMFGFGGSLPCQLSRDLAKDSEPFVNITTNIVYRGFPFDSNKSFQENDSDFIQEVELGWNAAAKEIYQFEEKQKILFTHIGPYYSPMSMEMTPEGRYVYMGSEKIWDFVHEKDKNIFLHAFSHCHDGFGASKIGKVHSVNGGTIHDGAFAVIDLKRGKDNKWGLAAQRLLNYYNLD